MTSIVPDQIETDKRDIGLYVTDDQLAGLLGVPWKDLKDALHMLDRDPRSGFPKKQPLWGNRRYWPALRNYFDKANGIFPQHTHPRRDEA